MDIWYNICTNMYMSVSKNRVYPETAICGREHEDKPVDLVVDFQTPHISYTIFIICFLISQYYPIYIRLSHKYAFVYIYIYVYTCILCVYAIDHIKTSNLGYSICTYDVLLDIITFIQIFVDSHIMVPWIFMRITKSILPYHNPIWMLYTLISH